MAFMQCPQCGKAGKYIEHEPKPRKRDGALVTTRVCHQYGCGYSTNVRIEYPEPVNAELAVLDYNDQYHFVF